MEKLLNPPAAPVERCEDTLDLPLEDGHQGEQQKAPVRPPVRPNRPKRRKGGRVPRIDKLILAYFLSLGIFGSATNKFLPWFLGSITKCRVIRTGGGFQVGYKKTPKTTKSNLSCKLSFLWALKGCLEVFVLSLKNHVGVIFKRFQRGWKE